MTFDPWQTPSIYVRKLSLKRKRIKAALTKKDFFIKKKKKKKIRRRRKVSIFLYFWVIFIGMN